MGGPEGEKPGEFYIDNESKTEMHAFQGIIFRKFIEIDYVASVILFKS